MTTKRCDDCPVDDALHDDVRDVLQAGALDAFAEADLAADALDLAEAEAGIRRPVIHWRRHVAVSAAILLAALALWALLPTPTEEDEAPPPETAAGLVAKERAKNLAIYSSDAVQKQLPKMARGTYAGIAGGEAFVFTKSLHGVSRMLDEAHPGARHRFVWRVGTEGDVTYTTDGDRILRIGGAFLEELGVTFAQRAEAMEFAREGTTLRLRGTQRLPIFAGSPDGMETVPLAVNYSTASREPLVLPPGMGFPRYEIPGRATVEAPGGKRQTGLRRYLVSVSVPGLRIREAFVEAVGGFRSLVEDDGSLAFAGHRFEALDDAVRERAKKAQRPLLVLERFPWLQRFPGIPFRGVEGEATLWEAITTLRYALAWAPAQGAETWAGNGNLAPPTHSLLSVFGPDGKPRGRLVVTSATKQAQIAALLGGVRFGPSPSGRPRSYAVQRSELIAIGTLRNLLAGQAHVQALGILDQDRDGVGEYAGMQELVGRSSARRPEPLKDPRVAAGDIRERIDGAVKMYGYWYRVFLPGKGGAGVAEGERGHAPGAVDADLAETTWCAYAWPDTYRESGIRTFFVNQDGAVWATDGCYGGHDGGPPPDAAMASPGPITGGVSPALPSVDGNRWKRVK